MSTHAKGTFEVKSWDEKPYSQIDGGPKLTRASVTKSFHGDIEGEGTLEYLMVYHAEWQGSRQRPGSEAQSSASFVGLERIVGRIRDRAGSFVLQHSGTHDGSAATDTYSVVPGSGTGDLRGLRGEGGFFATRHEPQVPFTLDYDLE